VHQAKKWQDRQVKNSKLLQLYKFFPGTGVDAQDGSAPVEASGYLSITRIRWQRGLWIIKRYSNDLQKKKTGLITQRN
jgi:hypothetical protein